MFHTFLLNAFYIPNWSTSSFLNSTHLLPPCIFTNSPLCMGCTFHSFLSEANFPSRFSISGSHLNYSTFYLFAYNFQSPVESKFLNCQFLLLISAPSTQLCYPTFMSEFFLGLQFWQWTQAGHTSISLLDLLPTLMSLISYSNSAVFLFTFLYPFVLSSPIKM